jgi:hypothetical protein
MFQQGAEPDRGPCGPLRVSSALGVGFGGSIALRIAYFFQGTLRKEEVASAFLAMAIEGVPRFRRHCFEVILADEFERFDAQQWTVSVEEERVDVRIESEDAVILIENKISSGAKQQGQLLRYYSREMKHRARKRIIAVFLAPREIGRDEVVRVMNASEFNSRTQDLVRHVSWEALADYVPDPSDLLDNLIRNGLDEIMKVIKDVRAGKYAREGDREVIRDIVDSAFMALRNRTTIRLRRWSGKDVEEIFTAGTNVTMWLHATFDVYDEPPFNPINLRDGNGMYQITIRSQFKLTGKLKKSSDLSRWWKTNMPSSYFDVPRVGVYHAQEDGWFIHTKCISGTKDTIADALAETGEALLGALSHRLISAGFSLARDGSSDT